MFLGKKNFSKKNAKCMTIQTFYPSHLFKIEKKNKPKLILRSHLLLKKNLVDIWQRIRNKLSNYILFSY